MTTQNDITPPDLVREVERLFADHLAPGRWVPLTRLRELIPDDLAAARCQSISPFVLDGQRDPKEYGRLKLAGEALEVLEGSGEYETRESDGKQEVRLERPTAGGPSASQPPPEIPIPAMTEEGACSPLQLTPKITIDPEFAQLLPAPTKEEAQQLEANLLADRECHDALVLWKGHGILLGGHHRLQICQTHDIPYRTVEVDLPDWDAARWWIIKDQLGRRNVPPDWASYWRGRLYNAAKQPHGGDRKATGSSAHAEHMKTAERLAEKFKVSPATVRRDGEFAESVDKIGEGGGSETRQDILSGRSGLTRKEVVEIARAGDPSAVKQAVQERMQKGGDSRKRKRKGASKGKANGEKTAAAAQPAAPDPNTITLTAKPADLARALFDGLGRQRARQVHQALGKLLAGDGRPAGASPRKPAAGRPR
jgi:hypothetical protein